MKSIKKILALLSIMAVSLILMTGSANALTYYPNGYVNSAGDVTYNVPACGTNPLVPIRSYRWYVYTNTITTTMVYTRMSVTHCNEAIEPALTSNYRVWLICAKYSNGEWWEKTFFEINGPGSRLYVGFVRDYDIAISAAARQNDLTTAQC